MGDPVRHGMLWRVYRTALLDAGAVQDARDDERATIQAVVVVVAASLALGAIEFELGWPAVLWATLASLLHWPLWVAISRVIGVNLLGRSAQWGELMRVLGLARTPGLLMPLSPWVGGLVFPVQLWTLMAGAVALRGLLGLSIPRAVLVAGAGMIPYWAVQSLLLH